MQIIGKDMIIETHLGPNGELLHRTNTGFQFGTGKDRQLITEMGQVSIYSPAIQEQVRAWLGSNGVQEAKQALMDREVAEHASEAPGTLDAMADKLGQDVKSQLYQMLKGALHQTVHPPSPSREVVMADEVKTVNGLPVVEDANGVNHILPDPELVKHPKVIPTDGGVLLDKGNGHKEFVPSDEINDLEEEQALIAQQDGKTMMTREESLVGARRKKR